MYIQETAEYYKIILYHKKIMPPEGISLGKD